MLQKGSKMAKKPTDPVCIFGASVISRYLEAMRKEVTGVKQAVDIEYIHRMRVASRRMRSALDSFQLCFNKKTYQRILKDVRQVTRALGEARDLDVQLEALEHEILKYSSPRLAPGLKRLQLRMINARSRAQTHVIQAMNRMESDSVLEEIEAWTAPLLAQASSVYLYSPELYTLAFNSIREEMDEFLRHEDLIHDPANVSELHEMRIGAKHLRYTLEIFEELYGSRIKPYIEEMKNIQDQLGNIHDLDVWIEMIPQFVRDERKRIFAYFEHERPLKRLLPGLEAFKADKIADRQAQYDSFIENWEQFSSTGTLQKILKLVSAPPNLDAVMDALDKAEQADPLPESGGSEAAEEL